MPFVMYVFAVSAFALGLAEFVPIGLTSIMADELSVGVKAAVATVTAYALGAVFAAPVLTALTANCRCDHKKSKIVCGTYIEHTVK